MLFQPRDSTGVDALNAEFLRLFQSSGWNKARVARELYLDPSAITRYVNLEARPSMTVLKLFSELLGERLTVGANEAVMPMSSLGGPRHLEAWEDELVGHLRDLDPPRRRAAIEALVALIKTLRQEPQTKYPEGGASVHALNDLPSQKVSTGDTLPGHDADTRRAAQAGAATAVQMVLRPKESKPSGKAASPSGDKSAPAAGTGPRSSKPSEPPTQAPA